MVKLVSENNARNPSRIHSEVGQMKMIQELESGNSGCDIVFHQNSLKITPSQIG